MTLEKKTPFGNLQAMCSTSTVWNGKNVFVVKETKDFLVP